jgi:hypothetical protein
MKLALTCTVSIFALAIGIVAGNAVAQTTANGPYYATPSWDQQLPASTRFVVLSNWVDPSFPSGGAAVLDRETGLVWQRTIATFAGSTTDNWSNTARICSYQTTGGRYGWRLPSIYEIGTLVDPATGIGSPFIFPSAVTVALWSSTVSSTTGLGPRAWAFVNVNSNVAFPNADVQTLKHEALCVRGGQGADTTLQ